MSETKMIRVESKYSSARSSIRYVGTEEELAAVVCNALKGNVRRLVIDREQPPYSATSTEPVAAQVRA